ncbi:MAG: MFS transporter [Armatimonadetes bacterium]|nr:MFS transporter [Armatimonadota bacterium]
MQPSTRGRIHPIRSALKTYRLNSFLNGLLFSAAWTIHTVFHIKNIGFGPFMVVFMGTLYELSIMLFEVPTGIVADLVSRRLSVAIGWFIVGIAFFIQGAFPVVGVVIAAQIILGIGDTFTSGAHDAWVADELPFSEPNLTAGQAFFLGQRASFWGRMVGPLLALGLSLYGLPTVLLVTGLGFFAFAIGARFWMTERGFHRSDQERHFWATFREGWSLVRVSRALFLVLLVSVFYGFASEGFDRLWNKIFLEAFALPHVGPFDDTFWWSMLGIVTQLGGMGLNIGLSKVLDTTSATSITRALIVLTSVLIFSILGFALTTSFVLAVCLYVVSRSIRRILDTLLTTWTNLYAPARTRATILSFSSQAHSLGEIGGGPIMGGIGQKISTTMAVVTAGLLLIPTLPVLFTAKKHSISDEASQ